MVVVGGWMVVVGRWMVVVDGWMVGGWMVLGSG